MFLKIALNLFDRQIEWEIWQKYAMLLQIICDENVISATNQPEMGVYLE